MRSILIITEQFTVGGLETHIQGEILRLLEKGVRVHLAVGRSFDPSLLPEGLASLTIGIPLDASISSLELSAATDGLRRIISNNAIDFVHVHPFTSIVPAVMAAELEGVRYAITLHGPASLSSCGPIYDFLLMDVVLPNAKLIIAVSPEVKKMLSAYSDDVFVTCIHNSVSFADFEGGHVANNENPHWLAVSRLDQFKIQGLIDFCIKARASGIPSVRIVGDGPSKNDLSQKLDEYGLSGYATLYGPSNQVNSLIHKSLGVAGMGRVVLEGIASQKPVILVGYDGVKGVIDEALLASAADGNFSGRGLPTIEADDLSEQLLNKTADADISLVYDFAKSSFNDRDAWVKFIEQLELVNPVSPSALTGLYHSLSISPINGTEPYLYNIQLLDRLESVVCCKSYFNPRLYASVSLTRQRIESTNLKQLVAERDQRVGDLAAEIQCHVASISQFEQERQVFKATLAERDQQVEDLAAEIRRHVACIAQFEQERQVFKAMLAERDRQVSDMAVEIQSHVAHIEKFEFEHQVFKATQAEQSVESARLNRALELETNRVVRTRSELQAVEQHIKAQLLEISDWAAGIEARPVTYAFKKTALTIARSVLRAMPVSITTKQYLRDIFFSTIRPLRRSVHHKATEARAAKEVAPLVADLSFTGVARDVFVFAVIDWHFRIQRPQHIARSLAESGRRVFYFSNHFVDADEPGYQLERLPGADALYQVKLHVKGAPAIYFAPPSEAALAMLTMSVAKVIQDFNALSSLSVIQHAYWYPLVKRIPNSYRVYDCMDHHEGFGNVPAELIEIEKEILGSADLITVTSSWLEDFARKHNSSVALVRNAAEYSHFATRREHVYTDDKGRRIIGYYGAIAEWFDLGLVRSIALTYPDCLILLVGNDTVGAQQLLADLPNVEFTGEVPYATLPFYLHAFDVCLLPFKVIPLTLATNPVKVYEYLAAGKPVVCVDLPEVGQFGDLVSRASSIDDFVAQVGASLFELGAVAERMSVERRLFASEQTWCHRGAELATALEAVRMPRISVIILTFNNLDLTRACLDSVLERSDYPNLEVIIVDNASSDGTPAYLEDFARRYPNVLLSLNSENFGFAAGNNIGLSIATGDYLVLLNNDTVVTQGWVMTLLRHFQHDPSLGIVGPVTNNIGNEARIDTRYQNIAQMPAEALQFTLANMGKTYPMQTAAFFCAMFPRSVYELCGPICEDYGRGFFEDDDYCRRVESIGKRIVCSEDVFIHHHLSASFNKLKQKERQKLFDDNKSIYEAKWGEWSPHSYRPNKLRSNV